MMDFTDPYTTQPQLHDCDSEDEKNGAWSKPTRELLEKRRTILISEGVSSGLTKKIIPQLLYLDSQSQDPITMMINTPGGSADDGFAIYDMVKFIKAPVNMICVGLNASAGTIILLASPKERRFALPSCRIMIHQPSGGAQGKASEIQITAEQILKLRHKANVLIAEETGKDFAEVERATNRDSWFDAESAKEFGMVSKIITSIEEIA